MTKQFSLRREFRCALIPFFWFFVALLAGAPLAYGQYSTTTTLTSWQNPSTYGMFATFSASVSNGYCMGWNGQGGPCSPAPTGNVNFYSGNTLLGSATLSCTPYCSAGFSTLFPTVGSYSMTAAYQGDSNNSPSTSSAVNQTVQKANSYIYWYNPSAITYGAALSSTQLNASSYPQGTFAYNPASGTVLTAGNNQTLSTTFTPSDTRDYNTATAQVSINVNPAALTITASGGSMTYGGTPPTVTPSYSGFVNGQGASSLTTQPTCSTTATSSTAAGTDTGADTCSGAVDANYSISYVAGNVTVNQASLTIAASNNSMTYGGTPPTVTPSYSGFVDGQSASSLTTQPTCSTTVTSSSPVGTYTGADTCSGAADSNYTISYASGTMTVTQDTPTVTLGLSWPCSTLTYGCQVTLTATVGSSLPTDTVTFYDFNGAVTLGSGTVNSNGVATLIISTLAPGSHSITATFNGDNNNTRNTSPVVGQTVKRNTMTLPWYCPTSQN